VSIDTEVFKYSRDSIQIQRQLSWLEKDLKVANQNRQQQPWIIVYGHKASWMEREVVRLEELIVKYNVDLYFCGHIHNYLRFFPFWKDNVQRFPDASRYLNPIYPVPVVTGAAGSREGLHLNEHGDLAKLAKEVEEYGYGILHVFNSSAVRWDFISVANEIETDHHREIADSFWIIKSDPQALE
jgi:hypothetical protein